MNSNPIVIGSKVIGPEHPPFIIAEMSGNHNQSLERALQIVDAAAQAGAHALKIQTYTADTMTLDTREGAFTITNSESLWKGSSLYNLYQQAYTPWEWHQHIFDRCKQHDMIGFSTPQDAFTYFVNLWRHYRVTVPKLDRYFVDWLADFTVVYPIPISALDWYSQARENGATCGSFDLCVEARSNRARL